MASPVVVVLCAVLLSACSGDAARPYRQFEAVTQKTSTWPTTTTRAPTIPPHCEHDGVIYPVGASAPSSDPCAHYCVCESHGHIQCIYSKSPRTCYVYPSPCVDPADVYDPDRCCPTQTCPNGRNCRNPNGGSPIPEGQSVNVNGQQCYCFVTTSPSGTYNTEVLCPITGLTG
ncbi:Hypp3019 [Branchiostoma lanceolatum]|uniref:Hypp3019 protein n=1 Tax=Branchiostoma lanceolatum TaxID=7740 RepID=A0A8J9ZW94_BRALA|nr:Hypp3019 [Branchiostoma lanceolatum]